VSIPDAPRQRILEAALELMAEHGYDGASLQQVADRVGLHKSTLFHHFKSKEELVHAVDAGIGERLLKRLEPILAEDPPRFESLLAALDASVEHFAEEPAAGRLLMRLLVTSRGRAAGAPVATDPADVQPIDRVLVLVGSWLARARAAGVIRNAPVRHTVINLMGLVLFYPAVVHHIPASVMRSDPLSAEMLDSRKRELRAFLSGALAPV
jgi:AcrR family transcriptional regulator